MGAVRGRAAGGKKEGLWAERRAGELLREMFDFPEPIARTQICVG